RKNVQDLRNKQTYRYPAQPLVAGVTTGDAVQPAKEANEKAPPVNRRAPAEPTAVGKGTEPEGRPESAGKPSRFADAEDKDRRKDVPLFQAPLDLPGEQPMPELGIVRAQGPDPQAPS